MAKVGTAVRDEALSFSQEITKSAEASLNPLQEDLADWISRVLDTKVPAEMFIDCLANGVLVCKLAQLIQDKAVECQRAGKAVKELPQRKIRCRENASAESFFARDNVANFLQWCRTIGLEDTCLFETEGLVLKKDPKNVLVCIYELARIAGRYGIEPPGLVKLEKEIEKEQKNPRPKSSATPSKKSRRSILDVEQEDEPQTDENCNNVVHEQIDLPLDPSETNIDKCTTLETPPPSPSHEVITPPEESDIAPPGESDIPLPEENDVPAPYEPLTPPPTPPPHETTIPLPEESSATPPEKKSTPPRQKRRTPSENGKGSPTCDQLVQSLAKTCDFPLEIQRISEGRYNIAGKVVFIRMLRGRHIMVRVGGGWDTLQHFLTRHDAMKTTKVDRGGEIKSLDGNSVPDEFYVIQAKYKGKGEA